MKVMKFGGSCLQSRAGLVRVIELVRPEPRPLVIVLSALKGITDRLIDLTDKASRGEPADTADTRARHLEVLETIDGEARKDAETSLSKHFDQLDRLLVGVAALGEVREFNGLNPVLSGQAAQAFARQDRDPFLFRLPQAFPSRPHSRNV